MVAASAPVSSSTSPSSVTTSANTSVTQNNGSVSSKCRLNGMVVCGSAIITDHDGTKHRVSHSSGAQNDQIICFISPSLSSVTSAIASVQFQPGGKQPLPFTINRGVLQGDVTVEIVMPHHLKGVSAIPVSVPAGQNDGLIEIQFADTGDIVLNAPIILRATIRNSQGTHLAEDKIDLVR